MAGNASYLTSAVLVGDTTIAVNAPAGPAAFPTDPQFPLYVRDELVIVHSVSIVGSVATYGVVRDNPEAHSVGEPVLDAEAYGDMRLVLEYLRLRGDVAGSSVLDAGAAGDSFLYPRFSMLADGQMRWGSGTGAQEVLLHRGASNQLDFEFQRAHFHGRQRFLSPFTELGPYASSPQNNLALSPADKAVYRLSASLAVNISGIVAGLEGDRVTLLNTGGFTLSLLHQSASSTDVNRIVCPGSANYSLLSNGGVDLIYDGTSDRWRVIG